MASNSENFLKLTMIECGGCDDIFCPHPTVPREGVRVKVIGETKEGELITRFGGWPWYEQMTPMLLSQGDVQAYAWRIFSWYGGFNSGHSYVTFVPMGEGEISEFTE